MDHAIDALKNNEEEIVRRFSGDPKDFIRKCTEVGIFSRAIGRMIKKSFEDLDSNVPRDVSIRYLLVHAYDSLQGNQGPFLKLLANYGVPAELVHTLTQSYTLSLAEGVSGAGGACVRGLKHPRNNLFLEMHVSALTEILAGQCDKWENNYWHISKLA